MIVTEHYNNQVKPFQNDHGKWQWTRADKSTRYTHHIRDKKNKVSLEIKEKRTIDLLKMSLSRVSKPVVSCSFGIDSIITLYLTRKALIELNRDPSDIDIIWNDTLNEFPSVRKYAKELTDSWDLRLIKTKPEKSLKKIIDDNGGITSDYFIARKGDRKNGQPLSEKCCGTLKHKPMKKAIKENTWDLVINGLRADESSQRLLAGLRDGEFFYSIAEWKSLVIRPILWWNEKDIWEYVKQENIPYNNLYKENLIQEYPKDLHNVLSSNNHIIEETGLNVEKLLEKEIKTVNRHQAILLEELGFKLFTPRTGCMMCPIPVKYGYLQWMRMYHPKVYNAMIHNLGYGKALVDLVPQDVKDEIKFFTGIEITKENADQHLKEILESKPCTFDKF